MAITTHLKSLQALELAVRSGSLRAAADQLCITPAAVGQRIKTLELFLGVELIVRGRSGLRPTAELSNALPHLARAFLELGAATKKLDLQRANEIHIAANSDWVELWLAPRIHRFRVEYPNIAFCINGEGDAPMRLSPSDIEVSFRPINFGGVTEILFRDYLVPIGTLENAQRTARLKRKNRLEGFPLLHLDFYKDDPSAISWPDWINAYGHRRSAPERGIRFQRIAPGLQAVSSDAGFMICGLALITDLIDRKEFVLPFPANKGAWTDHAFQARIRPDARNRNQIGSFVDWLVDESRTTLDWLLTKAG
jgi:LysR family glycine cleavage system transcriptional activator